MIKDARTLTLAVRPCFCITYVIWRFKIYDMSNEKLRLKLEIGDLKQVIFKQKTDFEMQKWEQSKNDLEFLKELQGRMRNWVDKNDWNERDYAFKMVEDWIDELEVVINDL